MMRALLVLLLLAGATRGAAQADPAGLFAQGREAYEAGDHAAAIAAWESLARVRPDAAAVAYNLGNAQYRSGRIGHAVLWWERALRLAPEDREAAENLAFVRRQLGTAEPAPGPAVRVWLRLAAALGHQQAVGLALLLWLLLGVAGPLALLGRGALRRAALAAAGLLALVLLALLPLVAWHIERLEDASRAVVLAPSASLNSGPGERYTQRQTVTAGLVVELRQRSGDWVQVELPNGVGGWLPLASVERVKP